MEYPFSWEFQLYTVSRLTSQIRQSVSSQFRDIFVEGEVSNQKLYPSGHLYFTLKDDSAMIRAVMFNCAGRYPQGALGNGVAVICRGRVDVYEKRGDYQLIVDAIEVKGLGLLQMKFQVLKEKLLKEGLFDAARKKPVPMVPGRVGIITSPVGAAIRDMLKVMGRKFENMSIILYPVKVQGDESAREIVRAIEYLNSTKEADVIILGRGGGSLEDLAPFNEEVVARAIHSSAIPIVTGIGHETDYTIADFVADVRTPTPTAAADFVVRDKEEILAMLADRERTLASSVKTLVERSRLSLYEATLRLREKKDYFTSYRMYVDELANTLVHSISSYLGDRRTTLDQLFQRISDLNPENILKRGYSITMKRQTGETVTAAGQVETGEELVVRLDQGQLDVTVTAKTEKGAW